jgi:hypothetical protein
MKNLGGIMGNSFRPLGSFYGLHTRKATLPTREKSDCVAQAVF